MLLLLLGCYIWKQKNRWIIPTAQSNFQIHHSTVNTKCFPLSLFERVLNSSEFSASKSLASRYYIWLQFGLLLAGFSVVVLAHFGQRLTNCVSVHCVCPLERIRAHAPFECRKHRKTGKLVQETHKMSHRTEGRVLKDVMQKGSSSQAQKKWQVDASHRKTGILSLSLMQVLVAKITNRQTTKLSELQHGSSFLCRLSPPSPWLFFYLAHTCMLSLFPLHSLTGSRM